MQRTLTHDEACALIRRVAADLSMKNRDRRKTPNMLDDGALYPDELAYIDTIRCYFQQHRNELDTITRDEIFLCSNGSVGCAVHALVHSINNIGHHTPHYISIFLSVISKTPHASHITDNLLQCCRYSNDPFIFKAERVFIPIINSPHFDPNFINSSSKDTLLEALFSSLEVNHRSLTTDTVKVINCILQHPLTNLPNALLIAKRHMYFREGNIVTHFTRNPIPATTQIIRDLHAKSISAKQKKFTLNMDRSNNRSYFFGVSRDVLDIITALSSHGFIDMPKQAAPEVQTKAPKNN